MNRRRKRWKLAKHANEEKHGKDKSFIIIIILEHILSEHLINAKRFGGMLGEEISPSK